MEILIDCQMSESCFENTDVSVTSVENNMIIEDQIAAIDSQNIDDSLIFPFEQNNLSTIQLERLVEEVSGHFNIQGLDLEIKDLYLKLDRILFFRENIGLYKISTHLLFLIDTSFPELIKNNDYITTTLLICCIITQKYFVDEPISNCAISRYFSVRLDILNNYEFYILKKLDFTLPFRLQRDT